MSTDINVVPVGTRDIPLHRQFIRFPHTLYRDNRCWVPFFNIDMRSFLTRRHPYFQNYPAQFFIARRDNVVVGTILASYNHRYIKSHDINTAHFFFYEVIDDVDVSRALFLHAERWARAQGAEKIMGPFMSGQATGSGLLVEGFEYPATMTMMRYNFPYYRAHLEALGLKKFADLYSYALKKDITQDARIARIARMVEKRSKFELHPLSSKRELLKMGDLLFDDFLNKLIGHYPENYPMGKNEQKQMTKDIKLIIKPYLLLVLKYAGKPVGYGLGFPDITSAMQKCKGKVTPIGIFRLLYAVRHTRRYICNGMGILPQYRNMGGSVLIYAEMYRVIKQDRLDGMEYTQIGETTAKIASELSPFIEKRSKVHRIMVKDI